MYTASTIDSTMKKESQQPIPFSRRPSTGSLSDSELSSSSLETPISYVTDPEADSKQEPPRTTRQKKDRRPPSTFVRQFRFPLCLFSLSPYEPIPYSLTVPQEEVRDDSSRIPLRLCERFG